MAVSSDQIKIDFKGRFLTDPAILEQKLAAVRAFVFDWDGVFNNGVKDENGASTFSEIDAMGTNLLRFNHWLVTRNNLFTAVISGERNPLAFNFVNREHFNEAYYKIRHKAEALNHICRFNNFQPEEVAFVFDDVLDFSAAKICGVRIMMGRIANPLLIEFAVNHDLVDYITANDGGNYGIRETVELVMAMSGKYDETIQQRMEFSEDYKQYWRMRNITEPVFFTSHETEIFQQNPQ